MPDHNCPNCGQQLTWCRDDSCWEARNIYPYDDPDRYHEASPPFPPDLAGWVCSACYGIRRHLWWDGEDDHNYDRPHWSTNDLTPIDEIDQIVASLNDQPQQAQVYICNRCNSPWNVYTSPSDCGEHWNYGQDMGGCGTCTNKDCTYGNSHYILTACTTPDHITTTPDPEPGVSLKWDPEQNDWVTA